MDERTFDRLVSSFASFRTRRRLLAVLAALPVGGLLNTNDWDDAAAERPNQRLGRRTQQRNRKQRNNKKNNKNNKNNGGGGGSNNNGGGGGNLGDPACLPARNANDQPTDLQQAINAASPFSNIVLCADFYLASNLSITKDVSLIGAGSNPSSQTQTVLTSSDGAGVFGVLSGNAFISNLVIGGANGDVPAIGIEGGSLTLANVRVGGNPAGGIVNLGGTLRLTQGSQVVGNGSDAEGGGILHRGGTTIVESGCLIQGNKATDGGGIFDATAATGDVQLGDSLIVSDNTPNNCSPAGTVQNCTN
jgi:hypothetical protein